MAGIRSTHFPELTIIIAIYWWVSTVRTSVGPSPVESVSFEQSHIISEALLAPDMTRLGLEISSVELSRLHVGPAVALSTLLMQTPTGKIPRKILSEASVPPQPSSHVGCWLRSECMLLFPSSSKACS